MQITHSVSGGFAYFPGLAQGKTIDTASLPTEQANAIKEHLERSNFFQLPSTVGSASSGRDMQEHTLTVNDGNQSHTVRFVGLITDPDIQSLIALLQSLRRSAP